MIFSSYSILEGEDVVVKEKICIKNEWKRKSQRVDGGRHTRKQKKKTKKVVGEDF